MKKKFTYPNFGKPDGYPDYTAHSGQTVEVIREGIEGEDYDNEGEKMYLVRADDGWLGWVWESELEDIERPEDKPDMAEEEYNSQHDIEY